MTFAACENSKRAIFSSERAKPRDAMLTLPGRYCVFSVFRPIQENKDFIMGCFIILNSTRLILC